MQLLHPSHLLVITRLAHACLPSESVLALYNGSIVADETDPIECARDPDATSEPPAACWFPARVSSVADDFRTLQVRWDDGETDFCTVASTDAKNAQSESCSSFFSRNGNIATDGDDIAPGSGRLTADELLHLGQDEFDLPPLPCTVLTRLGWNVLPSHFFGSAAGSLADEERARLSKGAEKGGHELISQDVAVRRLGETECDGHRRVLVGFEWHVAFQFGNSPAEIAQCGACFESVELRLASCARDGLSADDCDADELVKSVEFVGESAEARQREARATNEEL